LKKSIKKKIKKDNKLLPKYKKIEEKLEQKYNKNQQPFGILYKTENGSSISFTMG